MAIQDVEGVRNSVIDSQPICQRSSLSVLKSIFSLKRYGDVEIKF